MSEQDTLTQQGLFSDERLFEIKDGRYLFVDITRLKRNKNYQLDLIALEPKSKLHISIAWRWLVAAIAVVLTAYLVLELLPQLFDFSLENYALPITLGSASLAFLFLILFVVTTCRERVFVASNTNFPLVRLLIGKPNRKDYQAFLNHLENRIQTLTEHLQLDEQQRIAGELRMMRRLTKHNVLSEKEYERYKSKLMKLSG